MRGKIRVVSVFLIAISLLLPLTAIPTSAQEALPGGIPPDRRGEVLIVENHAGIFPDPTNFNGMVPGVSSAISGGSGFNQLCAAYLWYINTTNSELINWLAAAPPEYSPDFKTVKIYLRKGIYWNDGVPFTADDVVFTLKYLKEAPAGIGVSQKIWVQDVYKEDDYTVVVKLTNPNPRWHYTYTVIIYSAQRILPKHQWEGKDITKEKGYPPVCIGPYNLKDVDPGGAWFVWERYDDWWGTKLFGMKPAPKWVIFWHQGDESVKALAMSRHQLDAIRTYLPENFEIVWKNNPYVGGWRAKPPFAWPFDACVKGIAFNLLRYPYNITEVRRALAFAINFTEVWMAFVGPDGSAPTPSVLPVVRIPSADKVYYVPLKDELLKLGLDPNPPKVIGDYIAGIGLDPSIVWWKYDPREAERLLTSVGFKRGPDGKWLLPDGSRWVIDIIAPSGFEMESQRIGFLVADQWRRFGIEVNVRPSEAGVFWTASGKGQFDVGTYWPGCTQILDLGAHILGWQSKYFVPESPGIGWTAYKFPGRDRMESLLQQLEATPPWDTEKVYSLSREILLIWAQQVPWIGFFPTPFYTMNDGYCWSNWPYFPENYYMDPVYWWAQLLFIVLQLKPTGRCPAKEVAQPGSPPVLPVAKPTPTPTQTTPAVTTPAATAATTVTATVTAVRTMTTTLTSQVTAVVTTTAEVRATDWGTAAAIAIATLLVGIAVGYLVLGRRRS